jgi:hypothetical protein
MLHIPILRHGRPYRSIDVTTLVHHATGDPVAQMSIANAGLITRDIGRGDHRVLEGFTVADLIAKCAKAADLFLTAPLPLGDDKQTFDDYIGQLSGTTGMPVTYCRGNAEKIARVLREMERVLAGLTRGFDLSILDRGYGDDDGRMLSWFRAARTFGAVLPSNSPGVHALWIPAIALKTPIALKPGREEPWSPLRVIEALCAAGLPREAFGFYPAGHDGAGAILRGTDRSMLFGGAETTAPWKNDPRVELHGPGYSKILIGDDCADQWRDYLDVMVSSIAANGGRSCINTIAIWSPRHHREIAEALAERLATIKALPADDPAAEIAAFANPRAAEMMSAAIDAGLTQAGAEDVTRRVRGSDRLVRRGRCAWLLPTIIRIDDNEHALVNREFLFPQASVVACPVAEMAGAIGPSLVVTAITQHQSFIADLMACPDVDRLNIGPIPTWNLSWDQPHEGNLFEHLYRQRAFQIDPAA